MLTRDSGRKKVELEGKKGASGFVDGVEKKVGEEVRKVGETVEGKR